MTLYALNDDDVALLRLMLDWYRKLPKNQLTPIHPLPQRSSECLVALVPATGLPARSGSTPGFADCDIYRMEKNVTGNVILQDAGFQLRVYNLSSIQINAGYISISKERFGYWLYECPCATEL